MIKNRCQPQQNYSSYNWTSSDHLCNDCNVIDIIDIIFKFLSARHFPWDLLCQDWGLWREKQFLSGSFILVTEEFCQNTKIWRKTPGKLIIIAILSRRTQKKEFPVKLVYLQLSKLTPNSIEDQICWTCLQNYLSQEQHHDAVPSNFPQLRILSSANIFRIISPSAPPQPIGHNAGY